MSKLPLFAHPARVRSTDPDTSQEAADSLEPTAVGARCQEAYELIAHHGGLTVHQIVQLSESLPDGPWDRGNTARRITDLKQAGWIVDSGVRRRGPTGRRSIVWVPTQSDAA